MRAIRALVWLCLVGSCQAFSDLFVALYFLFGFQAGRFVEPRCEAGVQSLGIADDVSCSCLAEIEWFLIFPVLYGAASCRSKDSFCLDSAENKDCGSSAFGDVFTNAGDFASDSDLNAYFITESESSEDVYEIRIQAKKGQGTNLVRCTAFIDSVNECVDGCVICPDQKSFTVDCSGVSFVNGNTGPVISNCRTVAFRPA